MFRLGSGQAKQICIETTNGNTRRIGCDGRFVKPIYDSNFCRALESGD